MGKIKMKSFASALLVAGASAAFAAIDFSATGTMKFVNMSTTLLTLAQYGPKTDTTVTISDESQATWTIETAIATTNYKVTEKGAYINSAGFKVTNTIIYQPAASTDFVTNGLLYS